MSFYNFHGKNSINIIVFDTSESNSIDFICSLPICKSNLRNSYTFFPRIGGKIASINFEENWTTAFCESVSFIFVWRGNKFVIASNKSINTRKITVNGKQIYVDDFNEIKQITLILQKKKLIQSPAFNEHTDLARQ